MTRIKEAPAASGTQVGGAKLQKVTLHGNQPRVKDRAEWAFASEKCHDMAIPEIRVRSPSNYSQLAGDLEDPAGSGGPDHGPNPVLARNDVLGVVGEQT